MQTLFITLLTAFIYFVSAKAVAPLSLVETSSVFAVWPPTGVALAALLIFGYRAWIGVALGALLLNWSLTPFLPSLQIMVTNTAGPLLAAYIIKSVGKSFNFFDTIQSMILFFSAIAVASFVTAAGGSTALLMHGLISGDEIYSVMFGWLVGDFIGFLVITPLVVAWKLESPKLYESGRWVEVTAIALLLMGGGMVFFGPWAFFDLKRYPIEYMLFIPVLWGSIRFGALGGTVSVVMVSLMMIAGTINGYGPFIRSDSNDTLLLLQGYIWFLAVIALFSSTILRQKEKIRSSLEQTGEKLEKSLKALENNASEWVNALNQINDVVYILDLDRKILRANQAFYRMMHTSPEKAVGKHIVEIVHPEGELVPCPVCRAQEEKVDRVITMEADSPDNPGGRPIEVTVKMIHDAGGKPSAILMIIHDLTQSRKRDEELKLAATVFESTAEGLLITGHDQKILAANMAASVITGYRKEELVSMIPPLFEAGAGSRAFSAVIHEAIREEGFWRGEVETTTKSGKTLPLWIHINTVSDHSGRVTNYVILFLDITERKAAEAAVQEYQQTLEERVQEEVTKSKEQEQLLIQQSKLAAMGEMVGMIAHQWRQPLSALGLMIQDIAEAYEFGELDKAYLEETVTSSMKLLRHMSGTIDDFRNFFKKDQQKQHFSTQDVINGVRTVIGASLKNNGITLEITDADPLEMDNYFREFTQVVLNILNNAKDALKRTDKEKKWIRVDWSRAENGKCRVVISDNGGGIPEAIQAKIYDPYFTTKEQGHGTGIGLYMSKMIVERHMNGELSEENTGEGARFIIEV